MKNVVEIPKTQVIMTFVATCVETTARLLNTSYKEVYQRMKRVGLIERFILPHYETLHSESRENKAYTFMETFMWPMSLCGRWSMGCKVFGR